MNRLVEPELLDHLSPEAPEAIRSRRELKLINSLMGNHRWLRRQVMAELKPETRVLELGAGTGEFLMSLMASGKCTAGQVTAVDLAPPPPNWPSGAVWLQQDVTQIGEFPPADIIVSNLFLHHFQADDLRRLGSFVGTANSFFACEPTRHILHIAQGRLLSGIARLGTVTRHDMIVSIRAGFRGGELQAALGLENLDCRTSSTLLGAYRFSAKQRCERSP